MIRHQQARQILLCGIRAVPIYCFIASNIHITNIFTWQVASYNECYHHPDPALIISHHTFQSLISHHCQPCCSTRPTQVASPTRWQTLPVANPTRWQTLPVANPTWWQTLLGASTSTLSVCHCQHTSRCRVEGGSQRAPPYHAASERTLRGTAFPTDCLLHPEPRLTPSPTPTPTT